jgi:hypothetical protein
MEIPLTPFLDKRLLGTKQRTQPASQPVQSIVHEAKEELSLALLSRRYDLLEGRGEIPCLSALIANFSSFCLA